MFYDLYLEFDILKAFLFQILKKNNPPGHFDPSYASKGENVLVAFF